MLVDTSTLLRPLQPQSAQSIVVQHALKSLRMKGHALYVVPQNLVEFWVVATRPISQNGLGMTTGAADRELDRLKKTFRLLPETRELYSVWEALVTRYQVSGKPAHDARLVAAMIVHGLRSILTFDTKGFSRYAEIDVVHPADVELI